VVSSFAINRRCKSEMPSAKPSPQHTSTTSPPSRTVCKSQLLCIRTCSEISHTKLPYYNLSCVLTGFLLSCLMRLRRAKRIKEAMDARDEKLQTIAEKLVDLQQIMVNHGTQLRALYKGRREDITALVSDAVGDGSPAPGSPKATV